MIKRTAKIVYPDVFSGNDFQDKKHPDNKRFHNLRYIEKVADIPGGRTYGKTRSGGSTNGKSTTGYTVAVVLSFVKKNDKEFTPAPSSSKTVNADGTPKVMYRGGNESISVFDRKKSRPSNLYGRGFYFTDNEAHAKQYGDARPYYLDAKNPLRPGQHSITRQQMRAFLEVVAENEDDYDFWNYGQNATVESVLRDIYGKGDFEMLQDVSATAIGDLVAAVELFNSINGTDYDGIDLPTETVMFQSEKIKSATNNIGTFERQNPDIRYSVSTKELLRQQAEQYGEMKKGEKPRRDVTIPKRTTPKTKVGQTIRTIAEAPVTPERDVPTVEELVANGEFDYSPYGDEAALSGTE